MIRRTPIPTRTYTLFPYTTLFRTGVRSRLPLLMNRCHRAVGCDASVGTRNRLGRPHEQSAARSDSQHHFDDGRRCCCSAARSEEHTSELQSLMRISYAVFCLKKTSTL